LLSEQLLYPPWLESLKNSPGLMNSFLNKYGEDLIKKYRICA
jgi:hypothetical protein